MIFQLPRYPGLFEIPNDWLEEAGMTGFSADTAAFRHTGDTKLIALADIAPPDRMKTTENDWRGFCRERMVRVMSGIARGDVLPAVPLWRLPDEEFWTARPYEYRPRDGYHRFYASIAAGFTSIPATIDQLVL
jgi:hypothetical protein